MSSLRVFPRPRGAGCGTRPRHRHRTCRNRETFKLQSEHGIKNVRYWTLSREETERINLSAVVRCRGSCPESSTRITKRVTEKGRSRLRKVTNRNGVSLFARTSVDEVQRVSGDGGPFTANFPDPTFKERILRKVENVAVSAQYRTQMVFVLTFVILSDTPAPPPLPPTDAFYVPVYTKESVPETLVSRRRFGEKGPGEPNVLSHDDLCREGCQ